MTTPERGPGTAAGDRAETTAQDGPAASLPHGIEEEGRETGVDERKDTGPDVFDDPAALAAEPLEEDLHEEMPAMGLTRRRMIGVAAFIVLTIALMYFVVPNLAGLEDTWNRIQEGNGWWLALALVFTIASFAAYMWLFRAVFVRGHGRIGWSASYQITMAGLAATRLFSAGGAGGLILTAWAVRRSGMSRRKVACRLVAFTILLYAVFMVTLVVDGVLLRTGVFSGPAPFGVTVLPAILGAAAITVFSLMALIPGDLERRLARRARHHGRAAKLAARLGTVPASVASGTRTAARMVRDGEAGLFGALLWWALNILTLWACFRAFGESPTGGVLVMGFFCGMIGNLLPLPGGIGGVDGGMIGAFLAFGVDGGLAVVAVLSYRAFAFWLPTIPGVIAYFQLRRTVNGWREELGEPQRVRA
jgi:uncharacterized protein (TIRG00374 family)